MKTISVKIEGKTPLLVHHATMEELTQKTKRMGQTNETPLSARYYHHAEDEPYLPFYYVDRAIKNIAKTKKEPGKRGGSYYKSISGAFTIDPEEIPLKADTMQEFGRVVKRKDGNRVWSVSPMFNNWSLEFKVVVQDWFPDNVIRECLEDAGQVEGIGVWRPSCGGRFGKFEVTKWS